MRVKKNNCIIQSHGAIGMIYTKDFTIPKNTPESSPHHETLIVTKGLVYKVEFQFPAGCAGLVGLVVSDGGFQLWPSSLGEWFITDAFTIAFEDMYLKNTAPFQFDFWGFNLDETYDHTIYCRIGQADKEIFIARYLPNVAYEMVQKELAKTGDEQEAAKQELLANPFPWIKTEKGKT